MDEVNDGFRKSWDIEGTTVELAIDPMS
jgi:hypothetical protein